MKHFDSIDILFIILISGYLITFIGIVVLLTLKYKNYKRRSENEDEKDNLEYFKNVLSTPISKVEKETINKDIIKEDKTNKKKPVKKTNSDVKKTVAKRKKKTPSKSSAVKKKATSKKIGTHKKSVASTPKRKTTNKKSAQK